MKHVIVGLLVFLPFVSSAFVFDPATVVTISRDPSVPPTPEPEPTPTPAVEAPKVVAHGSSSVFRKLCNLHSAFGVGFCPKFDPMKGVVYAEAYDALIAELKK